MKWSDELKGMRRDAEKIAEAFRNAYKERDYVLLTIYTLTLPFMILGFIVGELIGRVIVFLLWKLLAILQGGDSGEE